MNLQKLLTTLQLGAPSYRGHFQLDVVSQGLELQQIQGGIKLYEGCYL